MSRPVDSDEGQSPVRQSNSTCLARRNDLVHIRVAYPLQPRRACTPSLLTSSTASTAARRRHPALRLHPSRRRERGARSLRTTRRPACKTRPPRRSSRGVRRRYNSSRSPPRLAARWASPIAGRRTGQLVADAKASCQNCLAIPIVKECTTSKRVTAVPAWTLADIGSGAPKSSAVTPSSWAIRRSSSGFQR